MMAGKVATDPTSLRDIIYGPKRQELPMLPQQMSESQRRSVRCKCWLIDFDEKHAEQRMDQIGVELSAILSSAERDGTKDSMETLESIRDMTARLDLARREIEKVRDRKDRLTSDEYAYIQGVNRRFEHNANPLEVQVTQAEYDRIEQLHIRTTRGIKLSEDEEERMVMAVYKTAKKEWKAGAFSDFREALIHFGIAGHITIDDGKVKYHDQEVEEIKQ